MSCELTHRYVPGYLDGELDLVHTIEMEAHLKGCPDCAQEAESLRALRAALQRSSLAYAAPGIVLGLVGRDVARLETCAQQCRNAGAEVVTAALDVRDANAMQTWLDHFDNTHSIDLLIANAYSSLAYFSSSFTIAFTISSSGTSALNISERHALISITFVGMGEQKINASTWFSKKSIY